MKSSRQRRVFSPEFKLQAVARMHERRAAGIAVSQVAQELGIRPDMLRAWARQAAERDGEAVRDVFPGQGRMPSDQEELRRLQRDNARLQEENDFLKKVSAFFAKTSR